MVGRANDASRVLEDQTITARSEAGEQVEDIARAIGRTTRHVSRRRKAMGCGRATVVLALQPIAGEVWKDRPDLRLKVSSLGRVACLRSNRLKAIIRNEEDRERGAAGYVSCYTRDGAKANKRFETLMLETFGREKPVRERTFSGRGSLPTSDSIWAEARRAVSYGLPHDVQDDLISDIVLMRLEGFPGSAAEAARIAMRSHSIMRGTFTERSLDAPIPGHDDLRLMDLIASDHEHF